MIAGRLLKYGKYMAGFSAALLTVKKIENKRRTPRRTTTNGNYTIRFEFDRTFNENVRNLSNTLVNNLIET